MIKHLRTTLEEPVCGHRKHRPKGWSNERRARQAARIREWAPWRRSTGPRTEAGKLRCAQNAFRHGDRSAERIQNLRLARDVLSVAERNLKIVRLIMRVRTAQGRSRIRYKPSYAHLCPVTRAQLALESLLMRKADLSGVARRAKPDCRSRWGGAIAAA